MLTKEDEEVVYTLIKESGLVVKYVDGANGVVDEEENVVRDKSTRGPDFHGEEVASCEHVHVGANELFPRRGVRSLRGRWDTMAT